MWRVVHVTLSEEGCIRCGGQLEPLGDGVELYPIHGARRFSVAAPRRFAEPSGSAPAEPKPSDPGLRIESDAVVEDGRDPSHI